MTTELEMNTGTGELLASLSTIEAVTLADENLYTVLTAFCNVQRTQVEPELIIPEDIYGLVTVGSKGVSATKLLSLSSISDKLSKLSKEGGLFKLVRTKIDVNGASIYGYRTSDELNIKFIEDFKANRRAEQKRIANANRPPKTKSTSNTLTERINTLESRNVNLTNRIEALEVALNG